MRKLPNSQPIENFGSKPNSRKDPLAEKPRQTSVHIYK